MNPQDTQITPHAIECFVRFLRDSRRQQSTSGDAQDEYEYARRKLREIMGTASYRQTDAQGRELWRSPPSKYNLRWLLAYSDNRKTREVIWVGASRPPRTMWALV